MNDIIGQIKCPFALRGVSEFNFFLEKHLLIPIRRGNQSFSISYIKLDEQKLRFFL